MKKLTYDQSIQVGSLYQAGSTCVELATLFKVSHPAILFHLNKQGVVRRERSQAARKFTCNHRFFSTIDTENKAYWLGFIAADGSIIRNSVSIHLSQRDGTHLKHLAAALESTHPLRVYSYPHQTFARFYLCSPQIVTDLASYGIVRNKTFTLRWPQIPSMQRHFLRGYFDGDGSFSISPNPMFRLTGNFEFLTACQSFLMNVCGLARTKFTQRHKESPIFDLTYGGRRQVLRIAEFLYHGATIYLARKRDKISLLNAACNIRSKATHISCASQSGSLSLCPGRGKAG